MASNLLLTSPMPGRSPVWATLLSIAFLSGQLIAPAFAQTTLATFPADGTIGGAAVDTDGDGQDDSAEVRAGTDPKSASSVFRILGVPARVVKGGWKVTWSSIPGRNYTLQRWNSRDLSSPGLPRWLDVTTVTAGDLTASADDLDIVATEQRFYRILLVEAVDPQVQQLVGLVTVNADSIQTNGTTLTPTGNVRIGLVTLSSTATLSVNSTQQSISGQGQVIVPGLGPVFEGAFTVDTSTGQLTPSAGTTPQFTPVPLNSQTALTPSLLLINVLTGALEGTGDIHIKLPEGALQPQSIRPATTLALGPVTLSGEFKLDPASQKVTVIGKAVYARVEGTGTATVTLADSTFELTGELAIKNDSNVDVFQLREAQFKLNWVNQRSVEFVLSGKPSLPTVAALGVTLTGTMDTAGNISLEGTGKGKLGPFEFDPATFSISRAADSGATVEVRFHGTGKVSGLGQAGLTGRVQTDGSLAELASTAELTLGNGIRLLPRVDSLGRPLPILKLLTRTGGVTQFEVNAVFFGPSESGTQLVEVAGELSFESIGGVDQVKSFSATNRLALSRVKLPGGVELENASLLLSRGDGLYRARLAGDLIVAKTGPIVAAKLPVDLLLQVSDSDPEDISIDASVTFAGVNLLNRAWFSNGQLRVVVETSPPSGSMELSDGEAGFFPLASALVDGRVRTDRPLGPVDFSLYARGVRAALAYTEAGLDLALTGGTIGLPAQFTTLAPGECDANTELPIAGVPSLGLAPGSALTLHYAFGSSIDTATLRYDGAFDLANFGFAIPAAEGQASPASVKLCSARIVFRGSELPAFENLSGRLRVRDLGQFRLISGRLDPRGEFAVEADGQVTLSNIDLTLTSLAASYANGRFQLTSSATAKFGNGIRLEPDDRTDPSQATPPVISASFDEATETYEIGFAGKLKLPNGEYVALRGRAGNDTLALSSSAALHLGDGVWIQPANNRPVLKLVATTQGSTEAGFEVNGAFLIPAADGAVRTVGIAGELHLEVDGDQVRISSFTASGNADGGWMLPGSIRLDSAGVKLGYETNQFSAALSGQVQIGPTTGTLTNATFIFEDQQNASNLRLDATIELREVKLASVASLQVGSARLELATSLSGNSPRFGFGRISLGGTAGLIPLGPLPANPTRKDFQLWVEGFGARLEFNPESVVFALTNGTLRLPELFTVATNRVCPDAASGPFVGLGAGTMIRLTYTAGAVSLSTEGSLVVGNMGFDVPGVAGLNAQLCSATLVLSSDQPPQLANVSGSVRLPLPGQNAQISIVDGAWKLNGYPSGTLFLGNDLKLLDHGGFTLTFLGGNSCGANNVASGITVEEGQTLGRLPQFTLHGGVKVAIPTSILRKAAGAVGVEAGSTTEQVAIETCGSITVFPDRLPDVRLDRTAVSGDFFLGSGGNAQAARGIGLASRQQIPSSQGISIKGANITLENIPNIFNLTPNTPNPFTIKLSGRIAIPNGPAFTLQDSLFVFDNSNPQIPGLPRFEPGAVAYEKSEWDLVNTLPIQVRAARLEFVDGGRNLPEILRPDNVKLTFSGSVAIPPSEPVVAGDVNDLQVTFREDGTPVFSVEGFGLTLQPGLKIPPIEELGGSVYVGGLNDPRNLFFAGRVGGSYQGYKLNFLLAFNLLGPIGLCLDVNAGAVGIPLDATGFLLTGASGGISFANSNGDPCSFQSYIDPTTGKPISNPTALPPGLPPLPASPMTWAGLKSFIEKFEEAERAYGPAATVAAVTLSPAPDESPIVKRAVALSSLPSSGSTPTIECPGGCPPPTVNIFCQPHPDQKRFPGRIITKFTSIDEGTLNRVFDITEERIRQLQSQGSNLAITLGHELRLKIDELTPLPEVSLVGAPRAEQIRRLQVSALDSIESAYVNAFQATLGNQSAPADIYALIRDLVYAGLPCVDVTFQVSATFSHLVVSSFLSVTGEGTLSTAGSAGVGGTVNLLGLPVGAGKLFVAATDARGLPNPSVCGDIQVALGPLELGWLSAAMRCDDCVTGVLSAFGQLIAGISGDVINNLLENVAPQFRGRSPQDLGALLSDREKTAFIAGLFQVPAALLPTDLPQRLINALGASFNNLNPQLMLCGEVRPKLFGLPLAPELVAASVQVSRAGRDATVRFSPSYLLALVIRPPFFIPSDLATIGYSEAWPDPSKALLAGLSGKLTPAAAGQFIEDNVLHVLQNSTYTISYEFSPLGFKIGRAQARVVNPNLVNHPIIRQPAWVRPEDRGLPGRVDLLMAAVRANVLGASLWKGSADDLHTVFPDPASQSSTRGLSLINDYFPHGGIIGAGYLNVPRALYEAPPPEWTTVFDPNANALARLGAAVTYLFEYVMKNVEAGSLTFYVPAPNPPSFTDTAGQPLKPSQLLESIMQFDVGNLRVGQLYSLEQGFLGGEIDGQILGVPVARARVVGLPADPAVGRSESILQITANGPMSGWLRSFVPNASLIFELRQAPPQTIEKWAAEAYAQLDGLLRSGVNESAAQLAVQNFLTAFAANLPKAKLESAVALQIPPELSQLIQLDGNASAELVAYSPSYDPAATGSGPIAEVKRRGGIALKANLKFGNLISVPNAELSVLPRPGALAALAGRFGPTAATLPGGVNLRDVMLDFDSAVPSLSAAGKMGPIQLGSVFQIVPLSGTDLAVDLKLGASAPASFELSPARLSFNSIFGSGLDIRVHGATAGDAFTYSTTGPWSASLSFQGTSPIELQLGGETIFRLARSSLQSASLGRDAQGVIRLSLNVAGNSTLTAFPDKTYAQSFTLSSATSLTIDSNGRFNLDAAVLDQASAGVTLKGRVTMTNDPDLLFTLGGTVTLPPMGGITIVPRVAASALQGSLVIQRNNNVLSAGLKIKPARATYTALTGASQSFLIDGGGDTQDFTFSTASAWSARLTLESASPLDLRAGNEVVLRINRSNVSSIGLARDEFGVIRISASIAGNSSLTIFPLKTFAQTIRLSSSATLNVNSDGTFAFTSSFADGLNLSGLPITGLAGGGSVTINQNGATLTGNLGGGALAQAPVTGTVTGSITIAATGLSLTGNAVVTVSPLIFDQFRIQPVNGGNFIASLGSGGLTIPTGAALLYRGFSLGALNLPAFTIPPNGDFNFRAGPVTVTLGGFTVESAGFTFRRANGLASIPDFAGILVVPGPNNTTLARTTVNGALAATGAFSVTGATSTSLNLGGLPVSSLSGNAGVTLASSGLTLSGSLGGGVLAQVSAVGNISGTLNVSTAGALSLAGNVTVTVSPLILGQFRIQPVNGGDFIATLGSNGLTIPSGARVYYKNVSLGAFSVPSFTIPSNGDYSFRYGPAASVTLGGFTVRNASFTFQRQKGVVSVPDFAGTLSVPQRSPVPLTELAVSGSLNQLGGFRLSGFTSGDLNVSSYILPVSTLGGKAAVTLTDSSLTLEGAVSGGALDQAPPAATATAKLTVFTSGNASISGSVNVRPLVVLPFHIESSKGGDIAAAFDDAGLKFSGARLKVDGILGGTVTLPDFTLPTDGNFSLPLNLPNMSIAGVPCASIRITVRRSNRVLSLNPMDVDLNIPGFNQHLSGFVNSSGALELNYDGNLTLGGFTSASGRLKLNNSGLSASGRFRIAASGATFNAGIDFSGAISTAGKFNLSGSGSLKLGNFTTDTFDLTLSSSGLSLGSGGARNLNFGALDVPFNTFNLSSSGITAFNGSQTVNSGWVGFLGVWARLSGVVTVSSSANGTISAHLGADFHWWVSGLQPAADFYPANQRLGKSGAINSEGNFFIGESRGNQNGFNFDLW